MSRDVRRGYLLGVATGAGLAAWVYPIAQYLTNAAAGRGMLDNKENRP